MALQVRAARDGDIQAITAIYAAEVRGHVNTYEYEPPDEAEMVRRMRELRSAGHPYLVAERDGSVLGYAYTSAFRGRAGYRFTVEDSVYVAADARGRGIGAARRRALVAARERRGMRQMMAVVGDPANAASIRLHERFGFRRMAVLPGIAWKHGRWLDTVFLQRSLGDGTGTDPMDGT